MPAEPVSERSVDELITRFNLWMFAARPHISDVEYRQSHWRVEHEGLGLRRTRILRDRMLPKQGSVLMAPPPPPLARSATPAEWGDLTLRVQTEIDYKAAKRELATLAQWLQLRDAAVAPWRPGRIPDGTVDGRLRRYGDHNYMFEVYVPRGTADQLEIVHIAHEVKNLCAKA